MYNRYITATHGQNEQRGAQWGAGTDRSWVQKLGETVNLLGSGAKNAGIAGILKGLGLEELDSGDVLLLLIVLLVFLEGDSTELVITLALMLLLGEGEHQKE